MTRRLIYASVALTLLVCLAACGKKDDQQEALKKARDFEITNFTEPKYIAPKPIPLPPSQKVEVPSAVKAKFSHVILVVGDRQTKEVKKFKVKIGDTAAVPGTDYRIKVISYLPHWIIRGNVVTSKDDKPEDPAIRATIFEKDKQVFDGYIFQRHQTPSFFTDKWAIGLAEASK